MVRPQVKLSEDFLAKYAEKKPFNNAFSEFIYLRTYSRWLEDKKRRENWLETCKRCVEYSFSLYSGHKTVLELTKEAEQMFDDMFHTAQLPSGRTLWVGGTDIVESIPTANYNCSFTVINNLEAFHDLFYLLMVGCGVGFSVEKKYVNQLPLFRKGIDLTVKDYVYRNVTNPPEQTMVDIIDGLAYVDIGDSREGWSGGLFDYLNLHTREDIESIVVDVDYVRPQGSRLKKFGGKASGPEPYVDMLKKIHQIIEEAPEVEPGWARLRPIDVLDICNIIGMNVVAGGVRRTAEIALMDADDEEMLHAKDEYWMSIRTNHRGMSNNSIMFWEKPSFEYLMKLTESIKNSYEPGFVNVAAASKRRPNMAGFNPCVEILLAPNGFCNLTTIYLMACVVETKHGKAIDFRKLSRLLRQGARHCMRITNVDIELPEWDKVQKRDRLLGVNLTGCEDAFDACDTGKTLDVGVYDDSRIIRVLNGSTVHEWTVDVLKSLANGEVNEEAASYAYEMRIPQPLLSCTIQPGGTLSLIYRDGPVSAGFHKSFGPVILRRVRINAFDALAKTLRKQGYKIYPETGKGWSKLPEEIKEYVHGIISDVHGVDDPNLVRADSKVFDACIKYVQDMVLDLADTWVIEFVYKTPAKTKASDESAISQLKRYFSYQKNYSDHNTSATIQVGDEEWQELFELLYERWDDFIGVSFQNKSNDKYDLAPYEAITEEEYDERIKNCPPIDIDLMNAIENGVNSADDDLDAGCATGACPVR